jgi:hypothetical protein
MKRILAVLILALVALYLGDYFLLRFRIWLGGKPFKTIRVQVYYAVPKKNGLPDFYFAPPRQEICVRSLFPHLGDPPCWYLERKSQQRINE